MLQKLSMLINNNSFKLLYLIYNYLNININNVFILQIFTSDYIHKGRFQHLWKKGDLHAQFLKVQTSL